MEGRELTQLIKTAPKTPGVYFWRDEKGRPLYIGKAADLRSRLTNYPKTLDPRIAGMVHEAVSLDWTEMESDIEALIQESQLIKRYRPKYNSQWMDDKQYFLVAVTAGDFPQFILTHQHNSTKIKQPIRELIGPFTEGVPLKATLRALRTLFPTCSCLTARDPAKRDKQKHHLRCLNAHIGKCPGYCCLKASATKEQKREYAAHVRAVRDILTGKRDTVIKQLEKDMKARAAHDDLEGALALRNLVERVRRVFQNAQFNASRTRTAARHHGALAQMTEEFALPAEPLRIEGYDIATIQGSHSAGAMVVFADGRADPSQYRLFNIKGDVEGDVPMLKQVLERRLTHPEWPTPDLIVVDGAKGQLNAVVSVLKSAGLDIPVLALAKDDHHRGDHVLSSRDVVARPLRAMPRQLADLLVHVDAEAHRFAISHYRKRHRKSSIGM